MGKDKNKDKEYQDGETAASSETITSPWDAHQSNRDLSQDWEARDATRDAVLAKTITEAVAREMAKAHAQYQALLNDRGTAALPTSLRLLQEQMVLWTPLTGPRTRLSTRDSSCGQRRLDSPLMLWKVTQKRLRFPNSIIGSMEREWDILSHGKTTQPSFASLSMMDWKNIKKKASTLQNM